MIFIFLDEQNLEMKQQQQQCHSNLLLKSPDKPTEKQILLPSNSNQCPNLLVPNVGLLNATGSTHSSIFYENTMHSDNSSLQKRKSVVSNQSTESSNEVVIHIIKFIINYKFNVLYFIII